MRNRMEIEEAAQTMAPTLSYEAGQISTKRIYLPFLDGLRGLAALQVVAFHFLGLELHRQSRLVRVAFLWTQFGHFAVDIFIVLSGFCLMLPVAHSKTNRLNTSFSAYWRRRALRILPPYYAALALSLLLIRWTHAPEGVTAGNVMAHLLLIHNLFPVYHSSINVAMWSVATEWQIYFFFPTLLLPVWKRFGNGAAVVTGFLVGLLPLAFFPDGRLNGACPWYLGLFAMGMAGAGVYTAQRDREWHGLKSLIWGGLLLMLAYVGAKWAQPEASGHGFNIQGIKDALGGGAAWCLIVYTACCTAQQAAKASESVNLDTSDACGKTKPARNPVRRLLEWKPLLCVGAFSYSLYLTHGVVLLGLSWLSARLAPGPLPEFVLRACVGIPVALGVAACFYRLIEAPSLAWRVTGVEGQR